MTARYTVVQYVPDPIADERVNIGVIAFDEKTVRVRFLQNWDRVRRFTVHNVGFLRDFAKELQRAATHAQQPLTSVQVLGIAERWRNSIQLTAPRGSLKDVDDLLAEVAARFLSEPRRQATTLRNRRAAARLATRQIRDALEARIGDDAEDLLRTRHPLEGSRKRHTFDAVVANGTPYFAAQGLSFEMPELGRLDTLLDATAFAIADVKAADPSLPLGVVVLPPTSKIAGGSEIHTVFDRTVHLYQDLGAEILTEDTVEQWAAKQVSRLPILFDHSHK